LATRTNATRGRARAEDVLVLTHGALLAAYLFVTFLHVGGDEYTTVASDLAIIPLSLGAFVASWVVSRNPAFDERARRAWRLFAFAYLCYAVGDLLWFVLEAVYQVPPYPSVADISYISFYPAMIGSLLLFSDKLESREDMVAFGLDAGTAMIAGTMFVWHFLLQPILRAEDVEPVVTAVSLAYPVCDLVLLLGVISLSMRRSAHRGSRLPAFLLVTALLFFCADVLFVYQNAAGTYESGSYADCLYAASYFVAVATARYGARRARLGAGVGAPAAPRERSFSALPYVAIVFAYGLLMVVPHEERELLTYGAIALTVVVVARQVVAARAVARAQEALRASDERFRLVAKATSDAVWDWNLTTGGVWWSDGVRTLFGYEPDDAPSTGELWLDQVHPDDRARVESYVRAAIDDGARTLSVEYRFRRADGAYAPVVDRGFIVRDEQGRPVRMVGSMMDVAERVRAEQAMTEARDAALESARLKSQFLANMSHEIRTPMNGVIGMTDIVLGTELSSEQREHLGMVKSSADSLLAIINDILDFSKIEAGKLELDAAPFDLRQTVGDTLSVLAVRAHERGLELAYRVPAAVPQGVLGDAGRLQQVLTNLVGNAIKFTERGEITVRVAVDEVRDGRAVLRFAVADTGVGIAPEKRRMIFDAFTQEDSSTTRRYGGTGLGLAISSQLVSLMGGRIWVESEPGRGSTFSFTAAFELADAPAPPADAGALAGLRVLVVDDNATNRRILEEVVREWGMESVAAADGAAALAEVELAEAAGAPFALVLLDAMMPDMDGFGVAERLKLHKRAAERTVLMLSSADQFGDAARCRDLGIDAHLTKPVRPAELRRTLLRALGRLEREAPASRPAQDAVQGGMKLLLAEDNRVNQLVATKMLRRRGHDVTVVGDGRQALEALDRERFDLVLMDVQMPVMDGFEATALIRERETMTGRHVPIVAMTAHAMKGDEERCLAAGMDGYVPKPLQAADLYATVESFARTTV
jgi:PAS domain S-box-containing protein